MDPKYIEVVSVPYWGSLYFNPFCHTTFNLCSFPSPIGVLYISMYNEKHNKKSYYVSVPYWGSLYFNGNIIRIVIRRQTMFPSPIGVLYISINYTDDVVNRFDFVSVPYWGSLYFNEREALK